jgi:hypothetical protein
MIMNWFIKQLAGAVLPLLRKQAQHVSLISNLLSDSSQISDHPEDMLYSERFSINADFYIHFLLPEFRAFIQSRHWSQPAIGCLGYAGIPVKGADYSLPLYSLLDPLQPFSPTIHRISTQREPSNESCSTVLSFFSCAQGNDHEYYTSADQMTISRPLIDEQKLVKNKAESQSRAYPESGRDRCCCCERSRFVCCC